MVSKKQYEEYKKAGKCISCGQPRGESSSTVRCQACHEKFNQTRLEKKFTRKEKDLCFQCGKNNPEGNSNYCAECRFKNAETKRKLTEKKINLYQENTNICRICQNSTEIFRVVCAKCLKETSFTRLDAVKRYGGFCFLCESRDLKNLCITSVDISKKMQKTGKTLYKVICYSGKPPSDYKVLCSVCYFRENLEYIKQSRSLYETSQNKNQYIPETGDDIIEI